MIAMPLLGWGMLSAAAYPVVLFGGWHLPAILPQSDSVYTLLWDDSSLRICNPHQLNLKRNADVKATGANRGGCAMLAEIFMIRLEAVARAAKEAANSPRFVPVTLPAAKAS